MGVAAGYRQNGMDDCCYKEEQFPVPAGCRNYWGVYDQQEAEVADDAG